jgi:GH24 family phage-related lysozyme (muramidase)
LTIPLTIGPDGLKLIKQFEGCKLQAYPDPATGGEPWTIGWGATGPGIKKGVVWTKAQADQRLYEDVARFGLQVNRGLNGAPTTQKQFDALVSFHYNTGSLLSSTLFRLHKARDYDGAANQFGFWIHADHKVLPGLVKRRAAEEALYRSGKP